MTISDFRSYMPTSRYIYLPTGQMFTRQAVNARLTVVDGEEPSRWLDRNAPVMQMTYAPGLPQLIQDKALIGGYWVECPGHVVFNAPRVPVRRPRGWHWVKR